MKESSAHLFLSTRLGPDKQRGHLLPIYSFSILKMSSQLIKYQKLIKKINTWSNDSHKQKQKNYCTVAITLGLTNTAVVPIIQSHCSNHNTSTNYKRWFEEARWCIWGNRTANRCDKETRSVWRGACHVKVNCAWARRTHIQLAGQLVSYARAKKCHNGIL